MPTAKTAPQFVCSPASPSLAEKVERYSFESHSTIASLVNDLPELEALRRRSRNGEQIVSMALWMAAAHPPKVWKPRIYLLRAGDRIEAAIFLFEQTLCGIPTGYFRGGEGLGEPLILCDEGREDVLLSRALTMLLNSRRAFLLLLERPVGQPKVLTLPRSVRIRHRSGMNNWHLPLGPTFDSTVASLGHRTRRNLRHALRLVQREHLELVPELSAAEMAEAVEYLAERSTHTYPRKAGQMRLRLAAETAGVFASGLRDAQGGWLSYIIGRRVGSTTEVFWQSNLRGYASGSLCTTMRALMLREEISRGATLVQYVGGTCPHMQHCCVPSQSQETTLARRGLRLWLSRLFLKTRFTTANHPLRKHF